MAFLSTNKQFKRLYPASLDDTETWDSYEELVAYATSPTSYVNQIIGCEGRAYIIRLNESGEKEVHPLMDGEANMYGFHIGPEAPEDTSLIWIDTSDEVIGTSFDSQVLDEFRAAYAFLQKQIDDLKASNSQLKSENTLLKNRVDELEEKINSGWQPSGPTGPIGPTGPTGPVVTDTFEFLLEDGSGSLSLEDGSGVLIMENGQDGPTVDTDNFGFLLEDGSGSLSLEDGSGVLIMENGPTGPTGPTGETVNNAMLLENGDILLTENSEYFIYE